MPVLERPLQTRFYPETFRHRPLDHEILTPDDFIEMGTGEPSDEVFYGIVTMTTMILLVLIFY